jgi:DNA (cytosine-5)-methyltransferase 1
LETKNQVCIQLSLVLTRLIATEAYVYQVAKDEVEESADLEVKGELFDEEEDSDDDSDDEVAPVRLLDDFTIYDSSTNQVIPTAFLLSLGPSGTSVSASGIVRRWVEDDDSWSDDEIDEEDDTESDSSSSRPHNSPDRVKLTEILELNVHHVTEHPKIKLDGYANFLYLSLFISV